MRTRVIASLLIVTGCGAEPLIEAPVPDRISEVTPEQTGPAPTTWQPAPVGVQAQADLPPLSLAPAAPAPEPTTPAADPSQSGPFKAGVRTIELTDASRQRTMKVEIWFPVAQDARGEDNEYQIETRVATLARLPTPALRNAPIAEGGPWPLVLFSHGYGGIRFQSYFLTEHLATHGYVVVAPDHPGNLLTDFARLGSDEAAAESAMDRPIDILFALEHLIGGHEPDIVIDASRIAVSGHSFGGYTSIAAAKMDPRLRVVLPMAPGFREGVTADFVSDLSRPLIMFGGSEDGTTPFDSDQMLPYELAQDPKALIKVNGAGHLDFSNLCDIRLARLFVNDGCDPDKIEPSHVQSIVRTVATAFLGRYLNGNGGYESTLDQTYVESLGPVDYWQAR